MKEQALLGFLPVGLISSSVPDWSKDLRTIDFGRQRKILPSRDFPAPKIARQNLPMRQNLPGDLGKFLQFDSKAVHGKPYFSGFSLVHGDTVQGEQK
jgi:hypothetical protein